ncbi:MAG: endonuclease/exonuclease/phosphatase family protein [Bacteroidaceae bacterium]|nr:endonuclease/exonuclease/phosphatase family protein [Bacteroidaceae bacterium]
MGYKAVHRLFYYLSIVLTLLIAGITASVVLIGNIPPIRSMFVTSVALFLFPILLINLVLTIYWIYRLRFWFVFPLAAIIINFGFILSIFQFRTSPSPGSIDKQNMFTVLTYNVGDRRMQLNKDTLLRISNFIKTQDADILCFQEMAPHRGLTIDSINNIFAKWPYRYFPPDTVFPFAIQTPIYSKYPIKNKGYYKFPNSKCSLLWCDFDVNGRTIRVINNYLQSTQLNMKEAMLEEKLACGGANAIEDAICSVFNLLKKNFVLRNSQAEVTCEFIKESPYPTLVCGDFNSVPSSHIYHIVKGKKLKDGFRTCGHGYMYTYRYLQRMLRIDYIFHTSQFEGLDYYSRKLNYSDHNPVIMEMKIKSTN